MVNELLLDDKLGNDFTFEGFMISLFNIVFVACFLLPLSSFLVIA